MQVYVLIGLLAYAADRFLRLYRYAPSYTAYHLHHACKGLSPCANLRVNDKDAYDSAWQSNTLVLCGQ